LPTAQVIARLAEQIDRTDHVFWPDDLSLADRDVFDFNGILGPNQITDAYLLAIAVKNAGRFATLDRGVSLRAVRGAKPQHLAVNIRRVGERGSVDDVIMLRATRCIHAPFFQTLTV